MGKISYSKHLPKERKYNEVKHLIYFILMKEQPFRLISGSFVTLVTQPLTIYTVVENAD